MSTPTNQATPHEGDLTNPDGNQPPVHTLEVPTGAVGDTGGPSTSHHLGNDDGGSSFSSDDDFDDARSNHSTCRSSGREEPLSGDRSPRANSGVGPTPMSFLLSTSSRKILFDAHAPRPSSGERPHG
jgi:hypothetical protein